MKIRNRIESVSKISCKIQREKKEVTTKYNFSKIVGCCTNERNSFFSKTMNVSEIYELVKNIEIIKNHYVSMRVQSIVEDSFDISYLEIIKLYIKILNKVFDKRLKFVSQIEINIKNKLLIGEMEPCYIVNKLNYIHIKLQIYGEKEYSSSITFVAETANEFNNAIKNWIYDVEKEMYSVESEIKNGTRKILLDSVAVGVIAHEIFGHNLERDWAFQPLDMVLQYTPWLSVIDNPCFEKHKLYMYDDFGNKSSENILVSNGKINKYINLDENIGIVTPNARAQDYRCFPLTRMSNTYIGIGTNYMNDILEKLDEEIVVDSIYNSVCFDAKYLYIPVRKAHINKLNKIISNINIRVNLCDLYLVKTSDKIEIKHMWCNKNGQEVLVGLGGPQILIERGEIINV